MIAAHIHDALAQVRELKIRVLNAQHFTGYSGRFRALGGIAALLAPFAMSTRWYPATDDAHVAGWGAVFLLAVLSNYSALLYWFLCHPESQRDVRRLMPTLDAIPPLLVGGILTGALLLNEQYDLLFGTWMCLYGVANLSAGKTLPKALWGLGSFYILCGTVCLLAIPVDVTNPWPMGMVFGIGEVTGGYIFHRNRVSHAAAGTFVDSQGQGHE